MSLPDIDRSPLAYARVAGAIYLLVIVFGGFSEGFVMSRLVISGDPVATARNIVAAPDLWRLSTAGNLIVPLIAVVQLCIEYLLLKPAGKGLALLFLLLNVVSLSVEAISKLFLLMVAPLLANNSFDPQLLPGLVGVALAAHGIAFNIALIFFGAACVVSGALIFRSRYLPRAIGVLMQIAGLSYLTACFAELFAPGLARAISPAILLPPLIGETSLCLWLLFRGVNLDVWRARTAAQIGSGRS